MTALRARDAVPGDYGAFVRLWRELDLDQAVLPDAAWRERLMASTFFLVDDADEPVGYALLFPLGARGDVRQIAVDRHWHRRGVGRQLMAAVAARLRGAGCTDWRLEVDATNAAAIALYTAVGLREIRAIQSVKMPRAALAQFGNLRSPRYTTTRVRPADEAAIERHYDFGTGELARWRKSRPEALVWQLHDVGELAGFARYWPDFQPEMGLVFPFRADDAAAAAHLLAHATPSPLPEHVELAVVDRPVAAALLRAGGELAQTQLELAGPL